MSECIICKGNNKLNDLGFSIIDVNDFLMRGAFWLGGPSDIWTFKYEGKEIDDIITDAQRQMNSGIKYQETQIYKLISSLLDNDVSFAMWYDGFVEDLDICNTKDDILETCYRQIMDENGLCEVYIVSNILKKDT